MASQSSHVPGGWREGFGIKRNRGGNDAPLLGEGTCGTDLPILDRGGHLCAATVCLLPALSVPGWKNLETGSLDPRPGPRFQGGGQERCCAFLGTELWDQRAEEVTEEKPGSTVAARLWSGSRRSKAPSAAFVFRRLSRRGGGRLNHPLTWIQLRPAFSFRQRCEAVKRRLGRLGAWTSASREQPSLLAATSPANGLGFRSYFPLIIVVDHPLTFQT